MPRRLDGTRLHPAVGGLALLLLLIASTAEPSSMATGASTRPAGPPDLASFLPDEILGYAPREKDGSFTADTLFDLIDGGAEVYRSFHVRQALSRRYTRPEAPEILADLFDMGSARDAFGAYHHDLRDGMDAGLGVESEISGSTLAFWKGRYFLSIVALADTPETREAVPALAREIALRIPQAGAKPEILRLLPAEGLERDRVSYFHDWTYLNTRHVIAEENLLLLDGETEGILARYRDPARGSGKESQASHLLLLVRYPSEERASRALERFRTGYLPGVGSEGTARRENGKWAAARREGEMIVVVLEAEEKPDIGKIVSGVRNARARLEGFGDEK